MNRVVDAWPFIATRNATLDWRPILAPPFLIEARSDYLLVTETSGVDPHPLAESRRVVEQTGVGTITLIFKSVAATTELFGEARGEPLLDRFGRPIFVVEGVVLHGQAELPPGALNTALDLVKALTLQHFGAFWREEEEGVPPKPSEPIPLSVTGPPGAPEERNQARGSRLTFPLIVAVVLALIAVVTWWWRARTA